MNATDNVDAMLAIAVLAMLIVLSGLTLIGVGSLAIEGIRLFRRWKAMR